ncbi:AAEL003688-PA, partial [Aedes aegypti]
IAVEVAGSSGMGRRNNDRDEYAGYGVETFVRESHPTETTSLLTSAKAWGRDHIYSGFEKMKILGAVSPIKVPPSAATPFISFSSNVNRKKSDAGIGSSSPAAGCSKQRTREGPHCEQFLKKIGVIKVDPNDEAEHSCSYRNEFCLRWQAYFKQLSSILTCGEAICIEVYLGPENHAILLEQWILKLKLKTSESTMTLQSLCAAIRSQLYFSQISAWTDLIKNSLEPEIFNNPRIKKVSVDELGASVSAPIPISSSSSSSSSGSHNGGGTSPLVLPKAKLDILFRIRGYDNTACFNDSPNVHNFPDAIIAENYVIEVCLKSLPRLERIPSINDEMDMKMDESLVNDRMDLPCHEKGKHRCAFRDEDEEDPQTGEDDMSPAAVSHREKQLMKYKKRMMKREKKKKSSAPEVTSTASNGSSSSHVEAVPMMVTPPVCKSPALNIPAVNHHASNCSSSSPYTSSINLIQPPLYSNCDDLYQPALCASNNTKATQTAIFLSSMSNSGNNVATVATQTDASGCCCLCAEQQPESDPGLRKAELLLQAIQRTAIINDHQQPDVAHFSNNNYYSGSYNDNNNTGSDTAKCDCRLCKRQKTKHNFKLALNNRPTNFSTDSSSPCFMLLNTYLRPAVELLLYTRQTQEGIMFAQPSPVDHLGRRPSPFTAPNVNRMQTSTPASSTSKLPLYVSCTDSDYSVSTASSISPHKKQILSCTAVAGNSRPGSKPSSSSSSNFTIPKINLTNVFNVSPLAREDSGFVSSSSPIPIDGSVFNFPDSTHRLNVQKSNSAPTCQLSPGSLSPRFLRHAYKNQRTRYLSERSSVSERSSIGSDEQFSDEDKLPSSPLKLNLAQRPFSKPFSKNLFKFGRLPLLGTLEESLFQRRIDPKFQVADFKVLLGASGSFCPTQLTIPVASYFYELPGQHLTTPYVCELRLPRKGYSIPRQGTVQVTLLNPLGTVVRMFVVPYDFRDMPAMSMTFIRQRILAYDDTSKGTIGNATGVEQLSNAEQMKLLRYAIHLRFQTSRSGKLSLHTDIRLLISRRTDCDTAAAHAKNLLEAPNELKVVTIVPENPKFSLRVDKQ